jgi:hypothetical protein
MLYPGVVSQRSYPQLGVTELRLVNGLRVALKATPFYADEVLVTALAVGGLSEVGGGCVKRGRKRGETVGGWEQAGPHGALSCVCVCTCVCVCVCVCRLPA